MQNRDFKMQMERLDLILSGLNIKTDAINRLSKRLSEETLEKKEKETKDEIPDKTVLYDEYVRQVCRELGGYDDETTEHQNNYQKILNLILTLTQENENDHFDKLTAAINRLRPHEASDQAFLINAATALMYVIDPKIYNSLKLKIESIKPKPQLPSENKETFFYFDRLPEVKTAPISDKILLPFLNKIGHVAPNQDKDRKPQEFSMLDLAIKRYAKEEKDLDSNENSEAFQNLIKLLFNHYTTPDLYQKIIRRGENISIKDVEAQRLGRALVALSRLEDKSLFRDLLSGLIDESSSCIELTRNSTGAPAYPEWISTSDETDRSDLRFLWRRTRRIAKLIMAPMLDELYETELTKRKLLRKVSDEKKSELTPTAMDLAVWQQFSHQDPSYVSDYIFEAEEIGVDPLELNLNRDPQLSFILEIRGMIQACLFSIHSNSPKNIEEGVNVYEMAHVLRGVQTCDAIHEFITATKDPRKNSQENLTKLEDKFKIHYENMHDESVRETVDFKRRLAVIGVWTAATIIGGALITAAIFFPPFGIALTAACMYGFPIATAIGAFAATAANHAMKNKNTFVDQPSLQAFRYVNQAKKQVSNLFYDPKLNEAKERLNKKYKKKFKAIGNKGIEAVADGILGGPTVSPNQVGHVLKAVK